MGTQWRSVKVGDLLQREHVGIMWATGMAGGSTTFLVYPIDGV